MSYGCTGVGLLSADGQAVRWNSSFDCSEVDSAPRSQGEHEHGVMVVDVKYALREDPLAGIHRATPTRPRLRRLILGGNLGQSHVRHPRCPSDLAGGSAKGHETSWV